MKSKIVSMDSDLQEVILKLSVVDKFEFISVMDGERLYGIISHTDLQNSYNANIDMQKVRACDICNTAYTYLRFEYLENDVYEYLNNSLLVQELPIINEDRKLITTLNRNSLGNYLNWINSQKYEIGFCHRNDILNRIKNRMNNSERIYTKKIYTNDLLPIEDNNLNENIYNSTVGKTALEIGCGPAGGFIANMWWTQKRIVIEPLFSEYMKLLNAIGAYNVFNNINQAYSQGADIFIPELKNSIDGIILCRNALDHTPNWPFILSNISSYAQKGAYLYLWTDIQHSALPNEGHYNITINKENIIRMLENLGFKILKFSSNRPCQRQNIFVEIIGVKE